MRRQSLVAAAGLFVVALLIAVTLYVSNLKAADAPPSKNPSATPAAADQIKQLQARIDSLEKRLAALEQGQIKIWDVSPLAPGSKSPHKFFLAPRLNVPGNEPIPSPPWDERDKDGFPKVRTIPIDSKD